MTNPAPSPAAVQLKAHCSPKLAVITSGGANFYSIEMALQRLGVSYELTTDKAVIQAADAALFPGVGAAGYAMQTLARQGLIAVIQNYRKPLLGICLGMQLLYDSSEESFAAEPVECLGIFPGTLRQFAASQELVVPHMGWNSLQACGESPLLAGVTAGSDVYFVHSYYAPVNEVTIASCDYGGEFAALAQRDNFYAMQFHPEKSGPLGAQLLANFMQLI